jgi:hypothetical protein
MYPEKTSVSTAINTPGTRKVSVTCVIDEERFINVGNSKCHFWLVVDEDDGIDFGEEAMISPRGPRVGFEILKFETQGAERSVPWFVARRSSQ